MPEIPKIDIRPDHWEIVQKILIKHVPDYEVWAFGSRARWNAKQYSDLDLAIITDKPLPLALSADISDELSESDLPWRVDVVDWAATSETFRKIIELDKVVVQEAKGNAGRSWVMRSDWPEIALTDIYKISSGLSKPADSFGSGYPFLSFKDVFGNYFIPDELSQLVESNEKERLKGSIKRGDVFLTRTSETMHELGMSSVALKDYPDATFNGFTKRLRPKEGTPYEVHPEFIGYYFRSPMFRRGMSAFSTMSTRASLNNDMIGKLTVELPPLEIQKNIAMILKALDNKIELNRQTNQTLEQIAQAIFKSWFVDFEPVKAKIQAKQMGQNPELAAMCAISGKTAEQLKGLDETTLQQLKTTATLFPDALVEYELGEIPEGWKYSKIGNEVKVVGGGTPSTKNIAFWEGGHIHWTSPRDMSNLTDKILLNTDRKITEAGLAKISSGLLPKNTVLMSSRAPVGYLAIAKIPVAINQGYIAMKCQSGLTPEYVVQWAESVMDEIKQRASGTTFAEISKKNFKIIPIVVPDGEVISEYSKITSNLYSKITEGIRETKYLTEIRNTLLPKLLSGKLSIDENQQYRRLG